MPNHGIISFFASVGYSSDERDDFKRSGIHKRTIAFNQLDCSSSNREIISCSISPHPVRWFFMWWKRYQTNYHLWGFKYLMNASWFYRKIIVYAGEVARNVCRSRFQHMMPNDGKSSTMVDYETVCICCPRCRRKSSPSPSRLVVRAWLKQ